MTSALAEHRTEPGPQRLRFPTRSVVVGLGVLLVALAAGWGWGWRTHPTVFPPAGNKWSGTLRAGQGFMLVGITSPETGAGEALVLHAAEPVVRNNSAQASFEFYVCTRPEGELSLGMVGGQRNFDRYCPDGVPVREGTRLDTGAAAAQQLVMLVRMDHPGVASTTGVKLSYSVGHQRGTQLIGPQVRVTSGDD